MPAHRALTALALQSTEEVEQALDEVFSRPEFDPPARSPFWEWLFEAIRAAAEFLRGLFPSLAFGQGSRSLLFWIVVALLALAAGFVALRLMRRVAARRRPARSADGAVDAGRAGAAAPETAEGWEQRARALASAGRWREAALALYQALLHRLDARGALRFDAAKTPGDYRRESRQDPDSYRLLDGFLRRFEPVAFGARVADAAAFDKLVEAAGIPTHHA